jgi:serine/threonine protein kinase
MALATGVRLGPYEILSALGAGGMGEVYRAHDTRLNRTVAIKMLPEEIANEAELRARFEREARAVAALDHPNICALYDVGNADGTPFLVMQHLDGETLSDRLARGPLPLQQTLTIAIELADALDRAHRAGVVHRDLKPANVMLTRSGAKLLDFGLAKLREAAEPISMSSLTRLAAPGTTSQGTILGTVHYMAPEQVEGKEVDARSDIFAFGAVLYEMITGKRPFAGGTPASVIGAILKDEPPPVSRLQPLAPPALDHIVGTCLAKDPDERWQSAGDIKHELSWVASTPPATGAGRRTSRRPALVVGWLLAAALLGAAASTTMVRLWTGPAAAPAVVRFSITPPEGTTFAATGASIPSVQMALSPDGRRLVFVATRPGGHAQLWVRALDATQAQLLAGTEDSSYPFWSPDSRFVGFLAQGKL